MTELNLKVVLNPYEGIDWDSVNFVSSALHNHTWFSNKEFEELLTLNFSPKTTNKCTKKVGAIVFLYNFVVW